MVAVRQEEEHLERRVLRDEVKHVPVQDVLDQRPEEDAGEQQQREDSESEAAAVPPPDAPGDQRNAEDPGEDGRRLRQTHFEDAAPEDRNPFLVLPVQRVRRAVDARKKPSKTASSG